MKIFQTTYFFIVKLFVFQKKHFQKSEYCLPTFRTVPEKIFVLETFQEK